MKTLLLALAFAFVDVSCPFHPLAICTPTGTHRHIAGDYYTMYRCTCGDNIWVKE